MPVLDPSQDAAATADHPLQLVLAGPGSGKTATLVGRFEHLVRTGTDPRRILAVTFTRKAAEEMRARTARALGMEESAPDLRCFTFHGLAFRCLQRKPHFAGLPERFEVWTAAQARAVFTRARMFWNEDGDILDIIAAAKEQLQDADAFEAALGEGDETGRLAAAFFRVYETALREAGAIDYADMVPLLLRALADHPGYGRVVAGAVDHLLVDEYQDINLGQHRLVEHFRAHGVRLWAVGDDDQTLFTFRAADVGYTLEFEARHGPARIHRLDRNYRSTPEIVEAAKRLIGHNRSRFAKPYRADREGGDLIVVRGYAEAEAEIRQVTRAVETLLRDGVPPREIAVLYRVGSLGLGFQGAFEARGIPFEVRGAGDLWQSAAARLFLGALFHLLDPGDARALVHMGTGKRAEAVRRRLDALPAAAQTDFKLACRKVRAIVSGILPKKSAEREQRDWSNVCDAVGSLAAGCASLDDLLRRIAEQTRAARRAPGDGAPGGAVVLSTVHSAKGLEWEAVFVVGMEEGFMPVKGSDIEEERRIAYVAVTRAKRILGLTYAAERGGTASTRSRFLDELAGGAWIETGPDADERMPLPGAGERPGAKPAPQAPGRATARRSRVRRPQARQA